MVDDICGRGSFQNSGSRGIDGAALVIWDIHYFASVDRSETPQRFLLGMLYGSTSDIPTICFDYYLAKIDCRQSEPNYKLSTFRAELSTIIGP